MKRALLILGLVIVTVTVGCRKKELRDVSTVDNFGPVHCENGLQDEDELGTDCGGADCDSCVQLEAPCSNPDDNLKFYDGTGGIVTNHPVISTSITEGSNWTFTATCDGVDDKMQFVFPGKPDVSQMYHGVSWSGAADEPNEVYIIWTSYSGPDVTGTGDVYVTIDESGVYTIQSCDYAFKPYGSSLEISGQFFRVSFD